MNRTLENKRILFISGGFYQYDEIIKRELENKGAVVSYYCSAPTHSHTTMRIYQRINRLREKYCSDLYNEIIKNDFDYIFILNTCRLTDEFVKRLSKHYSKAIKILYCWDAVKTIPEVECRIKYFDYAYTFDSGDAEKYDELSLLPLFYCNDYVEEQIKYKFSFVGFGHSKRYDFINICKRFSEKNGYNYCFNLYLPSMLYYIRGKYVTKTFKDASKTDFIFKSLGTDQVTKLMQQSEIIVDYEVGSQDGLTMRTIETLGAHRKLITTNKNVEKYDFYNTDNILIVDRDNPVIDDEFVKKPYSDMDEALYNKYHLSNWLDHMFLHNENEKYLK